MNIDTGTIITFAVAGAIAGFAIPDVDWKKGAMAAAAAAVIAPTVRGALPASLVNKTA